MKADVQICWIRLEGASTDEVEAVLSPDERARAARFRFRADRERFVVARGVLRRLLGDHLGTDPAGVEFAYSELGKPRLAADAAVRFSVAHSRDAVVLAFCESREIGVDVEAVREDMEVERIARRYLPPDEAAAILRKSGRDRVREFFRAWVRMEAYAKARGGGLNLLAEAPDPERWSVADLALFKGYAAAMAVEGDVPIRIRTNVLTSEILGRTSRLALE